LLFSRGCGLYLRAPGFDKTISYYSCTEFY
jgi:hypothetical protein